MKNINTIPLWRLTIFRIFVLYSVLFGLSVILLFTIVYRETERYMNVQTNKIIEWELRYFAQAKQDELPKVIAAAVQRDQVGNNFYGLFSADGHHIAGNLEAQPTGIPLDGQVHVVTTTLKIMLNGTQSEQDQMHENLRVTAISLRDGSNFYIIRNIRQFNEMRDTILNAELILGGFTLLIGAFAGMALSIKPLARLREIQAGCDNIAQGNLSTRLPESRRNSEFDLISKIINNMLDNIERLMSEVKCATDGIAHDLRTPLAHLITSLEHIKRAQIDSTENAYRIDTSLSEANILLTRFNTILRISEIENSSRDAERNQFNLYDLINDIFDLFQPVAEESQIDLQINGDKNIRIRADRGLMFEAISNLVSNAIKFNTPGGTVNIYLHQSKYGAQIDVIDTGIGIPEQERDAILTRFYRATNSYEFPGSGLGLSIAAAIVNFHDFHLSIESPGCGTRISINCWPK